MTVVEPAEARVVGREALRFRLRFGDARSGADLASLRVAVDGQDITSTCAVAAPFADCPAPHLARGSHLFTAQLSDRRGNRATAGKPFDLALPLQVAFTAPEAESFSAAPVVRLEGTVSPEARTVRVNGFDAVVQTGTFFLDDFPLRDGLNNLVAVAADEAGNTGSATLRVEADRTAPRLSVSAPSDGETVATPEIAVLGRVNDLVTGTVGKEEVTVTVNGVAASVAQRGFLASGVPLAPGPNTLEIAATDRGGNRTVEVLTVTFAPPSGARSLRAASGDGQGGPISTELPLPLVAALSDAAGQPAAGVRVIFRVIGGSGHFANGRRAEAVTTDANGLASARLTLGSRAGAATDRVRATVAGYAGEALFVADALPGPAAAIDVASGDAQVAALGTPLAQPLVALLTDGQQNPIVGATVTFRAVDGDGRFPNGSTEIEIVTDGSGLATVPFRLGSKEGWEAYRIEAGFPGRTSFPAVFLASGFPAGDPAATRISGVVLDNEDRPVPGVTLRLRDSAATALSDAAGRFTLAGVPPGQAFLIADASTTTRAGAWPNLEFELFAVAGLENSLPKPVYLLPLDLAHGVLVDETRGGRVTIPELPGFALDIAPGSVTFPGGSRSGLVSVTPVHADKIPMAPGSGMQPRLIVTIQPAGAHFDPPAALTLPNVDALLPGTVTEMFSFDHDIGAFVSIGTGSVSEDGRVLRSDPGFGVEEAGWHCGARQSPSGANASLSLSIFEKSREPVVFLIDDGGNGDGSALRRKAAGGGALTALGKPGTDSSYAWTVANPEIVAIFPEGEPLCSDSQVCATSAIPKSLGETLATAKLFSPTTGKSTTDQVRVVVARVRLQEVSYSGPTYREVVEDGTASPYSPPHWKDNSSTPDGDASDLGDHRFPVSFEQNGKVAVSATWTIEPAVTPGAGLLVRGEAEGLGMQIPPTPVTTTGGLVRLGTTPLTGQLPPGIGFLNPLKIAWQMSTDGGSNWINAGTSDSRVYVILGNPYGSDPLYETVLDIGCRNAAGKLDEESAVQAIWADFANPIPGVKRKPVDGKNRPDGQEMRYWINTSNPRLPDVGEQCQSLKAMLTLTPTDPELEGIGTCKAWSTLMQSAMQSIGISDVLRFEGRPKYFSPVPFGNTTRAHFLVNLWNLDRASLAHESCKLPGAVLLGEASDLEGSPGQGTENPPAEFDNHYIIMHKKQVYDPSYGIGPFLGSSEMEALNAWENSAIAGFYLRCRILGEDGLPRDLDVVKRNDPLQLESSFFPPQLEPQ